MGECIEQLRKEIFNNRYPLKRSKFDLNVKCSL